MWQASTLYGQLKRGIPKYAGLTVEHSNDVDEFLSDVQTEQERLRNAGQRVTQRDVAKRLAAQRRDVGLYQWWDALEKQDTGSLFNRDYADFLNQNQDTLGYWYPNLITTGFLEARGDRRDAPWRARTYAGPSPGPPPSAAAVGPLTPPRAATLSCVRARVIVCVAQRASLFGRNGTDPGAPMACPRAPAAAVGLAWLTCIGGPASGPVPLWVCSSD